MSDLEAFQYHALEYDKWFDNHKIEYDLELKAIREFLPKDGNGIEIGAGTGRFTAPLGISLGIEPSESMRSIALNRGVNVIAGRAESLPVEDGVYDYALLVTVDCFFEKPELVFKEVYRVLKTEGLIIVGFIDKNSTLGKRYEKNKHTSKFYKDANFHSVEEIQKKLVKIKFGNIKIVQALLPADINENVKIEVKSGYGDGSFVVLRAQKLDTSPYT